MIVLTTQCIKGPQRKTSPDCLPKTQVRAKAQADVYGLMPGQCQKVKRTWATSFFKP